MDRRDFLSTTLSLAAALPVLAFGRPEQAKAIARGPSLTPPKDGPVQIAIPVSPGTTWIDFAGPQAAFETYRYDAVEKKHKPLFKTFLVGEKREPMDGLIPDYTFDDAPPAQVVLVPAQRGSNALLDWLRKVSEGTDVTMSVCVGAVHLAKAGLLDGIQATSHHEAIAQFTKQFPKVKWVSGMRFVEGPKIATGGGLTAGIDLGLRVTERYYGRAWAKQVAEHLEYPGTGWIV